QTTNTNIPLADLYDYVPRFWLEEPGNTERLTPVNYITQFIPPNMQTHGDYIALKEDGALDNPGRLVSQINRRIIWETLIELGIRSQIGRSLARTGVATIY